MYAQCEWSDEKEVNRIFLDFAYTAWVLRVPRYLQIQNYYSSGASCFHSPFAVFDVMPDIASLEDIQLAQDTHM